MEEARPGVGVDGQMGSQGWLKVPKHLQKPKTGVQESLTPEMKAHIRLEALSREVLGVLEDLRDEKRWFILPGAGADAAEAGDSPTSLDCLAFGYLALMAVPDVPRSWLRDVIDGRYPGLRSFVEDMRAVCFGEQREPLPWINDPRSSSFLALGSRFAQGAISNVPGIGEELQRWWMRRSCKADGDGDRSKEPRDISDLLLAAGGTTAAVALLAVGFFSRLRSPLGAPEQRYERQKTALSSFGAAGALFDMSEPANLNIQN
jgi:hypothetical protein